MPELSTGRSTHRAFVEPHSENRSWQTGCGPPINECIIANALIDKQKGITWPNSRLSGQVIRSIKQAISYCGLCSAEKSSADKVMRMPISKQRNKHMQQVLIGAARPAPRYSDDSG